MTTHPDGNLPHALRSLHYAQNRLFEPQHRNQDSLYHQLAAAIPGAGGNHTRHANSSPPLNLDAVELKTEIDTAITAWTHHHRTGTTPQRVNKLRARRWRPQDVHSIRQIVRILKAWTATAEAVLDPTAYVALPDPCPNCNQRYAYRWNTSGEYVRDGALQIQIGGGCECMECHTQWPRQHLQLLGQVLGYPLPAGVLT